MRSSIPISIAIPEGTSSVAESNPLPRWNEAAFHDLYREIAPRLWSYIRRASGDPALADDLVQEAFYRFLRADLPARETLPMKAYLYRIANSLLVDHWRALKRERRWNLGNWWGDKSADGTGLGGDLMPLFERLKLQEQTLLWLAYVEGFDHREIALALQLREKSVRVLLFRARKKLAQILTSKGAKPEGAL